MKRLTIIMSNILLISSYLITMELSPEMTLSRKEAFYKLPHITLHNKLEHYDITTENTVITPRKSQKITLQPSDRPELTVFIDILKTEKLTLEFGELLPNNVCFTKKQNCIDVTYNGELRGSYECK
jgi:hypothetical protein